MATAPLWARAPPLQALTAPPGNCGGVWGDEHLLEVADPAHQENDEALEWVGEDHDPERFEPADVNRRLVGMGAP